MRKDDEVGSISVPGTHRASCLVVLFSILLAGCVSDAELLHSDDTVLAQKIAQDRAMADLKCPQAKADRPIRRVRMENWWDGLYNEYLVWVEGCDRQATYRVVCREANLCSLAD